MLSFYRRLILSGVTPLLSVAKSHKIVLTNQTALLFSLLSLPYFIIFQCFGLYAVSWSVVPSALILSACIVLNRLHYYTLSRFSLIVVSNLIGFFYVFAVGKNSGLPLVYFALLFIPLVLFGLKEFWYTALGTIFTFFCFILSHLLSPAFSSFYVISDTYMKYIYFSSGALAFGIIFSYLCLYQYQQDLFSDEIVKANVELEEKYQQDREFKFTSDIQQKLLPQTLPQLPHVTCDAVFIPARKVSGDFYDFIETEPGHLSFVVADIVGKGLPACLAMVTLKSIIYHFFSRRTESTFLLTELNQLICENPVINRFVPLFYGDLNLVDLTLLYTNAGHEPGLLFSNGEWIELTSPSDHLPLGSTPHAAYGSSTHTLKPGDILVFFTDGVPDARDKDKLSFGIDRIKAVVEKNREDTTHLSHSIYQELHTFSRGAIQHDDITIVTLCIS